MNLEIKVPRSVDVAVMVRNELEFSVIQTSTEMEIQWRKREKVARFCKKWPASGGIRTQFENWCNHEYHRFSYVRSQCGADRPCRPLSRNAHTQVTLTRTHARTFSCHVVACIYNNISVECSTVRSLFRRPYLWTNVCWHRVDPIDAEY